MMPMSNYQLAVIAQRLLLEDGGFTLDEFGNQPGEDFWAVSVKGKEQRFTFLPSLQQIEAYLQKHGDEASYFGGWCDDNGVYYLDCTLLFYHKHTAVHEAIRNKQKAIYNLATGETFTIPTGE